jgi:hypothetical protein
MIFQSLVHLRALLKSSLQVLLVGSLLLSGVRAETTYDEEYAKRIRFSGTVQPEGETPFGEEMNLLTGRVSFRQTDAAVPGVGPAVEIQRFTADPERSGSFSSEFASWAIAIPQITTLVPAVSRSGFNGGYWRVGLGADFSDKRCSQIASGMWSPPYQFYGPNSGGVEASDWWRGYHLQISGPGSQELLIRASSNSLKPSAGNYPAVTTSHWQIGCLPETSNQQPGEGFLVVDPQGTKYYLDRLDYAPYEPFASNQDGAFLQQPRALARMRASKVVDRFGNWVAFNYDGHRLVSLTSSDGRQINLYWRADAELVDRVISSGRTWTYEYIGLGTTAVSLSKISLPDGSTWEFSGSTGGGYFATSVMIYGCFPAPQVSSSSSGAIDGTATMKHPSGLLGTFRYSKRLHAQSYVLSWCDQGVETSNPYYMTYALVEKELSGPGVSPRVWRYAYEPPRASVDRDCPSNSCQGTAYTDVTSPDYVVTRYTHSTRMDALEGKLMRVDTGIVNGAPARTEVFEYTLAAGARPYPSPIGQGSHGANPYATGNNVPLRKKETTQEGMRFLWEVPSSCGAGAELCFDAFGRPLKIVRSNAPSP